MALTETKKRLVEKNHNLIYAFLSQMRLSVDDYYGLAAIGLCKAADAYQPGKSSFSTYAYRCMHNEIASHWRRESRQAAATSAIGLLQEENAWQAVEDKLTLAGGMRQLSDTDCMILSHVVNGYSCKEIAEKYGYSAGYIRNRKRNALQALRQQLSP